MIKVYDPKDFEDKSQSGLKFKKTGDSINIFNRFGDKIVELNLFYATEGIYCDTWYGFVTNEEYMEVMSGVYLYCFCKNSCTKKICNTQSLRMGMDKKTSEWFIDIILPQLLRAGLKYNAIVIPSDIYARQSMDFFERSMKDNLAMAFPSFDIALLWLQNLN